MTTDKQESALQAISDFGQQWEQLENARAIIEKQARRIAELEAMMFTPEEVRIALDETDFTWHNAVTQEMVDKLARQGAPR